MPHPPDRRSAISAPSKPGSSAPISAPTSTPPELAGDDFTRRQLDLFGHLIEAVGGADALWRLDVKPLPDEPFDWTAVQPEDESSSPRCSR